MDESFKIEPSKMTSLKQMQVIWGVDATGFNVPNNYYTQRELARELIKIGRVMDKTKARIALSREETKQYL